LACCNLKYNCNKANWSLKLWYYREREGEREKEVWLWDTMLPKREPKNIISKLDPRNMSLHKEISTFNTGRQKISSFSALISPNNGVDGIIYSVPKSVLVHILSLNNKNHVIMSSKTQYKPNKDPRIYRRKEEQKV